MFLCVDARACVCVCMAEMHDNKGRFEGCAMFMHTPIFDFAYFDPSDAPKMYGEEGRRLFMHAYAHAYTPWSASPLAFFLSDEAASHPPLQFMALAWLLIITLMCSLIC